MVLLFTLGLFSGFRVFLAVLAGRFDFLFFLNSSEETTAGFLFPSCAQVHRHSNRENDRGGRRVNTHRHAVAMRSGSWNN